MTDREFIEAMNTSAQTKCGGEVHLSDKGHMMYAFIPDEMSETFTKFLNSIWNS